MKKRIIGITLLVAILLTAIITVNAYTEEQENVAEALYELGLLRGTGTGFELDRIMTRAEGVTMLVRMMGKEEEALAGGDWDVPFTDVYEWSQGYIGYAYTHGITNGTAPYTFGSEMTLDEYMFLTLTLRALGYKDSGDEPQFVWNDPYALSVDVGLITEAVRDEEFTRGDAIMIFWRALGARLCETNITLSEYLILEGVFTKDEFDFACEIAENGRPNETIAPETDPEEPEETDAPETEETVDREPETTEKSPVDTEPEETTAPDTDPEDTKPEDTTAIDTEPEDTESKEPETTETQPEETETEDTTEQETDPEESEAPDDPNAGEEDEF